MYHFYFFKQYLWNLEQFMDRKKTLKEYSRYNQTFFNYSLEFINYIDSIALLYFAHIYYIYLNTVFSLSNLIRCILGFIFVSIIYFSIILRCLLNETIPNKYKRYIL